MPETRGRAVEMDRAQELVPRLSWANLPDFGVADRSGCACLHPYTGRMIALDGDVWAGYRVEAGNRDFLVYTIALFDEPNADAAVGISRFFVQFQPSATGGPGYALIGGEWEDPDGTTTRVSDDEARAHGRIDDVWALIDWLYFTDPMIHQVEHHHVWPTPTNWPGIVLRDDHSRRRGRWKFWRR